MGIVNFLFPGGGGNGNGQRNFFLEGGNNGEIFLRNPEPEIETFFTEMLTAK